MYDLCDSLKSEFDIDCDKFNYEVSSTLTPNQSLNNDRGDYWLHVDTGKAIMSENYEPPDILVQSSGSSIEMQRLIRSPGWFIIETGRKAFHTNDLMFSVIMKFLQLEWPYLRPLDRVIKFLPCLVVQTLHMYSIPITGSGVDDDKDLELLCKRIHSTFRIASVPNEGFGEDFGDD